MSNTKDSEMNLLTAPELRQIETRFGLQTVRPELVKFRREAEISAEGECSILFGFIFLVGKVGKHKVCCPLIIADTDVSTRGENESRFDIKEGTFRLYTPALSLLLAGEGDIDPEYVAAEIAKLEEKTPASFPFGNDQIKLIESIQNSVPNKYRTQFVSSQIKAVDEATFADVYGSNNFLVLFTVALMKVDALPDFTVEKEINEIITRGDANNTAVSQLIRRIGQNNEGDSSVNDNKYEQFKLLEVLRLSEEQRRVVEYAQISDLTVVSGPPGTGKSHTISSLAINLAFNGHTVLITSKTKEAVSVVVDKLQNLGGKYVVAHVGEKDQKKVFASLIKGILQYERLPTNREYEEISNRHNKIIKEKERLSAAVAQINKQHSAFQKSRSELDALDLLNIELTAHKLTIEELDAIKRNADWIAKALRQPIPKITVRLKARILLNRLNRDLCLHGKPDFQVSILSAKKAYHSKAIEGFKNKLAHNRPIEQIWRAYTEAVENEIDASKACFDKWRGTRLEAVLSHGNRDNTSQLRQYAKALETPVTNHRANYISKIMEGTDSGLLLKSFPIWACTSMHLSQALKLEPKLFDYVIIDEASLCDPATAIPAMYRAKRAIVVGDEKQLKHRTAFVDNSKLSALAIKNGLDTISEQEFNYKNSIYEIASSRAHKAGLFMLDEHFRSLPPIIGFSSEKFYDGRLKVMRRNPINEKTQCVEFIHVNGQRNENKVITEEYDKALQIVKGLGDKEPHVPFGVITMTEDQAKYMNARFAEEPSVDAWIRNNKFKCGTPQSFQGDQRHTIILCLGVNHGKDGGSLRHVLDDNRFNVAVTRAEDRMIVISSISNDNFEGNLREYFRHVSGLSNREDWNAAEKFESNFEKEVYDTLVSAGFKVHAQYESCGYRIDFVVINGNKFVAIEADGPHHFDSQGNYVPNDVERASRLIRGGWHIERISCYEWEKGTSAKKKFLDRITSKVQ